MIKNVMMDAVANLEKAKIAADEALKPYGFRLCNADNMTIKPESGILFVDCKLVFCLPNTAGSVCFWGCVVRLPSGVYPQVVS